jgi:hypothetical protein
MFFAKTFLPKHAPGDNVMMFIGSKSDSYDHPVDVVESIAAINAWDFERNDEDEICITVGGSFCEYQLSFTWLGEMQALHLSCAFDLKVSERRRAEILALIARLNERLWVGHFDLWSTQNVVMFRHALLLPGEAKPSTEQCEIAMKIALDACEQYYQAFQFVLWAGQSAGEALEAALLETAGEA